MKTCLQQRKWGLKSSHVVYYSTQYGFDNKWCNSSLTTFVPFSQAKSKELDELNKELRQCNLQQFIQQTGPPVQTGVQPDEDIAYLMPDGQSDEDSNHSVLEFNPRTTAKQILGNPRSLQNPLVSSLHPEVLSSREVSWR
ncbi:hypothetical protein NFI96_031501 [Prochilodus magdalenae]|nr:hypothetical protein NFI96_031501 [Prochilodus magdalenae]